MKKVSKEMLSHMDEEEILEYINSLEDAIEADTDTEKTLDEIIRNVLEQYKNFKDIRHLRALNITAVNDLIKTKADLRERVISNKKAVLDTVMKKRAMDAKNKTLVEISGQESGISANLDLKTLLIQLDQLNIHPIVDKSMLESADSLVAKEVESIGNKKKDGDPIEVEISEGAPEKK